jgi:hypothetical protein
MTQMRHGETSTIKSYSKPHHGHARLIVDSPIMHPKQAQKKPEKKEYYWVSGLTLPPIREFRNQYCCLDIFMMDEREQKVCIETLHGRTISAS